MALRVDVTTLEDPLGRTFRYEFDGDRAQILLGRRGGVDILLPQAQVSLVHARIERRGDGYTITDDGSTNGTHINGRVLPTAEPQPLSDGDLVAIGDFQLQVGIDGDAATSDGAAENPAAVARRMVRDVLERLGPAEVQPSLVILDGPQAGAALLSCPTSAARTCWGAATKWSCGSTTSICGKSMRRWSGTPNGSACAT